MNRECKQLGITCVEAVVTGVKIESIVKSRRIGTVHNVALEYNQDPYESLKAQEMVGELWLRNQNGARHIPKFPSFPGEKILSESDGGKDPPVISLLQITEPPNGMTNMPFDQDISSMGAN